MPVGPAGVLVCGNCVADLLVHPVNEIRWNGTVWVQAMERSIGGNGANTAYALATLGASVRLFSCVGGDVYGDELLAELRRAGVDVSRVTRSSAPTPVTIALVRSDGARAFLHRPGSSAVAFAEPPELDTALISDCSHFHLANPYALPHMRRHAAETLKRAQEAGLTTSVDTGWDAKGEWMKVLAPCLQWTDILFCNEEEAKLLTGRQNWREAAQDFQGHGVKVVVIKRGGDGCGVLSQGGESELPAFPVPVVDTTGAGDVFAGAFLAALCRNWSLEAAARLANAAAALSVGALGSVRGLRNFEETARFAASNSV